MSRRKRPKQHANHERWLVSYADFITLLFAFFVVMFSSSQVDKRKVGRIAHQMQTAFQELGIFDAATSNIALPGGEALFVEDGQKSGRQALDLGRTPAAPTSTLEIQQELETSLRAEIRNNSVSVKVRHDALVITLREAGFFDSGGAEVRPQAREALATIAATLSKANNPLRIEGHTDNVPIHTARYASNWDLSTARATGMVKYFVMTQHFPPDRLSAAGYAEYHPVAGNDTAEGRALNRRVDIVVLGAAGLSR